MWKLLQTSFTTTSFTFQALQNVKAPLATHYGSIAGLAEMGTEVIASANSF